MLFVEGEAHDGSCSCICDYSERKKYSLIGVTVDIELDEPFYQLKMMRIELWLIEQLWVDVKLCERIFPTIELCL